LITVVRTVSRPSGLLVSSSKLNHFM
jgi:hypothetical protein